MTTIPPVEGTVTVNRLDTVEDADEAACALLGYAKHELIGVHGTELIPPASQPATAVAIDRMRLGELAVQQDCRMRRKDGVLLSVDVSAEMLPNGRMIFRLRPRLRS